MRTAVGGGAPRRRARRGRWRAAADGVWRDGSASGGEAGDVRWRRGLAELAAGARAAVAAGG